MNRKWNTRFLPRAIFAMDDVLPFQFRIPSSGKAYPLPPADLPFPLSMLCLSTIHPIMIIIQQTKKKSISPTPFRAKQHSTQNRDENDHFTPPCSIHPSVPPSLRVGSGSPGIIIILLDGRKLCQFHHHPRWRSSR